MALSSGSKKSHQSDSDSDSEDEDENDELRKMMGWLSGHEPQPRMMMETYKRQVGEALGPEKVGEASGEGGRKDW
jgi:hypothetical protein